MAREIEGIMLRHWKISNHASRITSGDPSLAFAVRRMLCPVITLVALILSLLAWGQQFAGPYLIIAVLALIGVIDFVEVPHSSGGKLAFGSLLQFFFETALRWSMVFSAIVALVYFSGVATGLSEKVLLTWSLATPVLLWLGQIAAVHFGLRQMAPRRAVLIGLTDLGVRLQGTLGEDPFMCTRVLGFFEDRSPDRHPTASQQTILGTTRQLPEFLKSQHVDTVYITLPMSRHPRIIELLESLRDSTASIYFVPDLIMSNLVQARLDLVRGIPVVAVRESPFFGVPSVSKRICDLGIGSIAAVAMLPLLVAIAIGVRLTSPGPILFKQKRYGLDGQLIMMYKFRSMTVTEDGESQYTQVSRDDARVTRFGAFIRRTSLDELPQIFNVLSGTMSIVGPRPHVVSVNEQYRKLIPSYMVRHKVKPGITGWAQVHGYRGGDDLESMTNRVKMDLEYLAHWSLRMDMMILIRTVGMLIRNRQAY
jgi:Undecaprenyl-phosphate glucose phosphotransferase